jgi:hypothetical protein
MTAQSASARQAAPARFGKDSLMGIGLGVGLAVVAVLVCTLADAPAAVTGPVTTGAMGIPAAIEYQLAARRRDTAEDAARIRRGKLDRPIGLLVMMFVVVMALALFLVDQGAGYVFDAISARIGASHIELSDSTANVLDVVFLGLGPIFAVGACAFFIASYASHYLGKHPYLWTAVAVGCAWVIRVLYVLLIVEDAVKSLIPILLITFIGHLILLGFCLAGTWYGRRHHDKFLEKKLARMERKALREAAKRGNIAPPVEQWKRIVREHVELVSLEKVPGGATIEVAVSAHMPAKWKAYLIAGMTERQIDWSEIGDNVIKIPTKDAKDAPGVVAAIDVAIDCANKQYETIDIRQKTDLEKKEAELKKMQDELNKARD